MKQPSISIPRRRAHAVLALAAASAASIAHASQPFRLDYSSLSNISVNRLTVLPLNSPPINGFVPQVLMGLTTEQDKNDFTFESAPSSSPGGVSLPSAGPTYYAVATLDTGSDSHIISYSDSQVFNLAGSNPSRAGGYTADIIGASGTETTDVSDALGVYATGFQNASVVGGAVVVAPGSLKGQTNTSILSAEVGSQLPSLLGSPIIAQYQAVISNSQTRRLTVGATTYRSPSVTFQPLDTALPAGYYRLTLDLQGPNGVTPTPAYIPSLDNLNNPADNPTSPSFWASMIATSVNVSGTGGSATNQQFLFDTGAEVTVLSEDTAAAVGFYTGGPNPSTPDFTIQVQGVGGTTQDVPGFYMQSLSVLTNGGPLVWTNVPVVVLDVTDPRDGIGFVPGILGTNLFSDRDLIVNGGTFNPSVGISPAITPKWNVDASGNWGEDAKWILGVPDGADLQANFLSGITAPRTITVDGNYTLGSMKFDSAFRYTIAGSGILTMQSSSGPATITVVTGSHTISAPVTLASNLSVTVTPATSVLTMSGNLTATGKAISKDGAGTWELVNLRAASLAISAGTLRILSNGTATGTSLLAAVPTITGTGKLDINNNALVINYTGASPLASVRQLLINGRGPTGFGNATWNGSGGIVSSKASPAAQGLGGIGNGVDPAIGYGENSALPIHTFTSFAGQSVGTSSILVKYTRGADATLDGVVDNSDVTVVGTEFNSPTSGQWYLGDFDYSGSCDNSDVTALGTLFNPTQPPLSPAQLTAQFGSAFAQAFAAGQTMNLSASVPEPSVATLVLLGAGILRRVRQKRAK